MLGKPVDRVQDVERWRDIAVREARHAEERVTQAADRVREAERLLAEAQARYEVELACAVAARAWRQRVEHSLTRLPEAGTSEVRAA